MRYSFLLITIAFCTFLSCTIPEEKIPQVVLDVEKKLIEIEDSILEPFNRGGYTQVDDKITITSTSIDTLGMILDFSKFRPTAVQFKYVFHARLAMDEVFTLPVRRDFYLEALMYFDSASWRGMNAFELHLEWKMQFNFMEEFEFSWLPENAHNQLLNAYPPYRGHPDFFFGTVGGAKLWYLRRKLLLKWRS